MFNNTEKKAYISSKEEDEFLFLSFVVFRCGRLRQHFSPPRYVINLSFCQRYNTT